MMSKLIEIKLLLDRKTVQDLSNLRVKMLHTRIHQNIHEMEREKDSLHQNHHTSIQLKDR